MARARRGKNQALIMRRRELVARLRARQMSLREIAEEIGRDETYRNPRTGRPYTMVQVLRDLRWVEEQWRQHALEHIERHKARVLAEIAELKRQGWVQKDLGTLVKALARECAVLGLDAPQRIEGAGGGDKPVRVVISYEDDVDGAGAGDGANAPAVAVGSQASAGPVKELTIEPEDE